MDTTGEAPTRSFGRIEEVAEAGVTGKSETTPGEDSGVSNKVVIARNFPDFQIVDWGPTEIVQQGIRLFYMKTLFILHCAIQVAATSSKYRLYLKKVQS